MIKILGFLIFISAVIDAQKLDPGACPSVTPMATFDITQITGKWYEYSKYLNILQIQGHCDVVTIAANTDGTYSLVNKQLLIASNAEMGLSSTIKVDNSAGNGQLAFTNSLISVPLLFTSWYPMAVLDTDYVNYMVVYSCIDILSLYHVSFLWVYTRSSAPSSTVVNNAVAAIDGKGLDRTTPYPYFQTDQLLCPSGW